jgi:hypothetical protein
MPRVATNYLLLAETITTDEDGQTVDGLHGVMDALDEFVPLDGYTGSIAAHILDQNRHEAPDDTDPLELAERILGALDHVEERDGEVIAYAADLPRVDDDEPYVRAVAVRFAEVAHCLACGTDLDRDCFGEDRCPDCDGPLPWLLRRSGPGW